VIGMHTDELDWATNSWTIPSHRSKNRRAHHVPLSSLSRKLIRRALALATVADFSDDPDAPMPKAVLAYRGPIFPTATGEAVNRHVLSRAMNRVCEKLTIEDATAHDLRRTGASMMASERCGVRGEVIARILNHTPLTRRAGAVGRDDRGDVRAKMKELLFRHGGVLSAQHKLDKRLSRERRSKSMLRFSQLVSALNKQPWHAAPKPEKSVVVRDRRWSCRTNGIIATDRNSLKSASNKATYPC
jgi:hypothetical protein